MWMTMDECEMRSELEPWNVKCETITIVEQMRSACRLSACPQVALIDHRLVLGLVGLVGRTLRVELLLVTVEQLYLLAVDQL